MAGHLDALEGDNGSIASIALTDSSPVLTLTATQLIANSAVLLNISSSYGLTVSGTASVAQVLAANATLAGKLTAGFAISDKSSAVAVRWTRCKAITGRSPRSR